MDRVDRARPLPAPLDSSEELVAGFRAGRRLGARRDPLSGRNSNQKHRVVTDRRNNDLERKLSVSLGAEVRGRRIDRVFRIPRGAARIAHQRADHGSDRTRRTAGVSPVQNQSLDFEGAFAGVQVDPGIAVSRSPGPCAALDLTHRVVHARCRNNSFDPTPANNRIGLRKCSRAQRQCQQTNLLHSRLFPFHVLI